ncbi:MAG TPA: selenocysteine-specific translation elongation factor [Actinomycetota bacterium]|jgi:selenocysteine-specific elongation factor|nr:selenocysteine-specific translation elongation factor [Actinomycetota bacterium]
MTERTPGANEPALHVVATAGHVDHGKSSLLVRLTGIDPDRLAEEKRRGLTIDLGFAWCTLPSGREVGFVDVPGHERFVRNMLAGMGPVRLVLFVVAADEGWKPQSEEHLQIVDVLGAHAGVVALTKRDLVDEPTLERRTAEIRERLAGTVLEAAPIVPCSSATGAGIEQLARALDTVVAGAPLPERDGRPRLFVDRVFTIRGAGTVVTGTLTGGPLAVGQEVELYPSGGLARIRGLQTHRRPIEVALPVSRVAVNIVGVERGRIERGTVIGLPGAWRPTRELEARIRPIRGLDRPLTGRGAFMLHAGSAERHARIRLYGTSEIRASQGVFLRIRLSEPLVLDVFDRFVLRETGRRRTVAGGIVLDVDPPARPGPVLQERLEARARAPRSELPALLVAERGAVRAADVEVLTGIGPSEIAGAVRVGGWWVSDRAQRAVAGALVDALSRLHRAEPLLPGMDVGRARAIALEALRGTTVATGTASEEALVPADALLEILQADGIVVREGQVVRLSEHRVTLAGRQDEIERLVRLVEDREPSAPTVSELLAAGTPREILDAATRAGLLIRVSPDLLMTPEFLRRAEAIVREAGPSGITVARFRERLGTSRKYALPLLEHLDRHGVTIRRGDLRFARSAG